MEARRNEAFLAVARLAAELRAGRIGREDAIRRAVRVMLDECLDVIPEHVRTRAAEKVTELCLEYPLLRSRLEHLLLRPDLTANPEVDP